MYYENVSNGLFNQWGILLYYFVVPTTVIYNNNLVTVEIV